MLMATARTTLPDAPHHPALAPVTSLPTRPRRAVPRSTTTATSPFPLAPPAWSQWHDVLVPTADGTAVPVDAVVLGPTGVHVVLRQLTGSADSVPAASAAAAVTAVLPARYRAVVTAALLDEAAGDGAVVDGVLVATTAGLVEAVRLRPRVLSRSETGVLAATLARALAPQVVPATRTGLWSRLTRRSRGSARRAA
ncbi:hypothetical protein GCM10027596_30940 [Nocardioides korecus]